MVMPPNVSKLDLVNTKTVEIATQVERVIVISSHGNVGLPARPLLGNNNVAETIVVMTTTVMEVPHHHGRLVAAVATTIAVTDKVVVMVVLPAVELPPGNDRTMLLHLLPRAINMAMVDIQEAMEDQAVVMEVSRLWVLLLVLAAGLVVLVLHRVWALCFKTTARMELQVALLHLHLRTIFLHQ